MSAKKTLIEQALQLALHFAIFKRNIIAGAPS
jgi:hypothetical protein